MRQVPNFTSYTLVGAGKLSKHLEYYLNALSLPFNTWARQSHEPFTKEKVSGSSHILLAISDDSLVGFIEEFSFIKEKCIVHFSGSSVIEGAICAHPLMTFSTVLSNIDFYKKIPFVYEDTNLTFSDLLPGFPNPNFPLEASKRSYYHALCVMTGNFPYILWCKAQKEFSEKFNLPGDILVPLIKKTLENCFLEGVPGLTGPLSRGDEKTLSKHLETLEEDSFKEVYQAFIKAYRVEKL